MTCGMLALNELTLIENVAGPEGVPRDVVASLNSTTNVVKLCWLPPDQDTENGRLLGYTIHCVEQSGELKSLNVSVSDNLSCSDLTDLQVTVPYQLSVSAFNSAGTGPFSKPVEILIPEGPPTSAATNVSVFALSSTRVQLSFIAPLHAARRSTLAYRVVARPLSVGGGQETRDRRSLPEQDGLLIVTGSLVGKRVEKVQLGGLRKFTEYQVSVICFTLAGDGPSSDPVYVQTLEDCKCPSDVPFVAV